MAKYAIVAGKKEGGSFTGSNGVKAARTGEKALYEQGFPRKKVRTLYGRSANWHNFLEELGWLRGVQGPEDIVVIYLAGHAGILIPVQELKEEMASFSSLHQLVLLAFCSSSQLVSDLAAEHRIVVGASAAGLRVTKTGNSWSDYFWELVLQGHSIQQCYEIFHSNGSLMSDKYGESFYL